MRLMKNNSVLTFWHVSESSITWIIIDDELLPFICQLLYVELIYVM